MAEPSPRPRWALRPALRAVHRDAGYLAVGLTVVYASSGIAVNHLADWDPNFTRAELRHTVPVPLPPSDEAAAGVVLAALGVSGPPREVYRAGPDSLEILLEGRTLHLDTRRGQVVEERETPRPLLRAANWLHLNRGKKAWTLVADAYAVGLLLLAGSGLFMIPGRRGIRGRGAVLVVLGALVPVGYVALSGGP